MKKKLFSKLKDYNYILDKVLEEKNFSEDAKNLLLNMIYKIEVSYKDYAQIKGIYQKESEYIDEIINIISDRCKYLFLIDPKNDEVKMLKQQNVLALTNEREKRIYAYPTELAILYGIVEIKPKFFYIPRNYYYIKSQMQRTLVQGTILNNTEVIRNFNGWSWNLAEDENIDHVSNIIYQAIRILIDEDFLKMWEQDTSAKVDFIYELRKELVEYYGKENSRAFYLAMTKLLIANSNKEEKNKLKVELTKVAEAYENIKNKAEYIYRATEERKAIANSIEKIDVLLNDGKKLTKEFINRNSKLPDEKKIFNVGSLAEILQVERDKKIKRMNELNKLMNPTDYAQLKNQITEKLHIMSALREKKTVRDYEIAFLKEGIKCLGANIDKIKSKEEVLDIVYKVRYYRKLRVTENEKVEDINILNNEIRKLLKYVITYACKNKIFNIFCKDVEGNFKIYEQLLDVAVPNYEDIDISIKLEGEFLEITVYDNEVIDKQATIEFHYSSKDLGIRQKKRIPMYVL